jgi:hypothetical protein
MISGSAIRQLLHFRLKPFAALGVSYTDVRLMMWFLLIGFEALGHNWVDLVPAVVMTQNVLVGAEPVRA